MTESNADDVLDFQRAQFDAPPPAQACQRCERPFTGRYFSLNGRGICTSCLDKARSEQRSSLPRALLLGSVAGVLGAAVYYTVRVLFSDQALITILIGIAVGMGVRVGAGGSRSVGWQLLAVGLSYVAMCSTYVGTMLEALEPGQHALLGVKLSIVVLTALAVPAWHVVHADVLNVVIFGFGLWQAWRLSAPRPFVVQGPFVQRASNT